ncbi:MAG: competence/damage-inducible protein A [Oscillospiraceae bacterium]|nr:competence/damage-inducible protein A [Oscillospiraceae bacterium]
MRAEIISVGDEVLRGDIVNTNTSFLAARLSELGFTVSYQCSVGDNERDLLEAIRRAVSRSHLVVFTGGLGPTEDDLTKETVAKAIGRGLYEDMETAEGLKAWFASRGVVMSENNLKQALVIEGSQILKNRNGTAPGIYIRQGNQAIVLLPGPPRELEPLFFEQVVPRLEELTDSISHFITLSIIGIGESALEPVIKDLLYSDNPYAACYAKTGEVEVRITSRAKTKEEAVQNAVELADRIKARIGAFVYSDAGKTLAETVAQKLTDSNKRIAIAESCTGGLMASELTAVPGISAVFDYGISSYADWVKMRDLDVDRMFIRKYTAISSQVAAEMAKGALHEGRASVGVGITGQAGPVVDPKDGKEVGLVYVAVADREKVVVKEFRFGAGRGREYVRILAVKNAFDMVRRILDNMTIEDAHVFRHKDAADLTPKEAKEGKKGRGAQGLLVLLTAVMAAATLYLAFGGQYVPSSEKSMVSRVKIDYFLASEEPGNSAEGIHDFAALNPDTVALLAVKGTEYGGVVVQGGDNEYYGLRGFDKKEDSAGCLFADCGVEFSSKQLANITIYGSGRSEAQFGFLQRYTDIEFLRASPLISLETLYFEARAYKIAAVFYADLSAEDGGLQFSRYFEFSDRDEFTDFVVNAKLRSICNTPVDIVFGDRFLTLVSGSSEWEGARLVILAREVRDGESEGVEAKEVERNLGVIYPDEWYVLNGSAPLSDRETEYVKWLSWLKAGDKSFFDDEDENSNEAPHVTAVDDAEAEEVIGTPVDTGEGTGMIGPGAPSGGGSDGGGNPETGQITVTSAGTGRQISGSPLEIVSMIVEAEVGSSFHPEAIKAQAVATITYLKYSYRTSSAPVMPLMTASNTVKNCVAEVIDTAMLYNGAYIYSPYCSSMAGRSNACDEVWVQSLPYLVSVESKYDSEVGGYNRTYTWTKDEMQKILEEYYEIKLSDVPEDWIQVLSYTSGGYVGNLSIDGKYSTTGSRFRSNCVFIRSAAFSHSYDPDAARFTITTSGYGHGVGMSQYGANFYARYEGMGYQQILSHYYTGVSFGSAKW